ncbi:MAG: sigma 54-interacting transcriptional regulator [Planctomycetes bacterium]|nr:sigma 54-interacting transcriptional regulator [Planctomycetota bacterium]
MTAAGEDPRALFPAAAFADRYLVDTVWTGGEGQTALVRSRQGDATAVIKVLHQDVAPAEASLLLSLRHPAIPAVREIGRLPDGRAFLIRDHIVGRTLATAMPLTADVAVPIARQALEVLAYVHLRGILHLDLKPQNLILGDDGTLFVLDFGLGVRQGERAAGGTPFFAAPEQLLGGTPDPRSDLFALGAVLVVALWPHGGKPPLQRFLQCFPQQTFWHAADIRADDFPAPFPRFLERLLARRPQRRFGDAQEALEFLVGGAGRPSRSLLAPDAVGWFGDELTAAATAAGDGDVILAGGTAADRQRLGMHLLCTLPDVKELAPTAAELRVRRGGGAGLHWSVPELRRDRLAPWLDATLGLPAPALDPTIDWLRQQGPDVGATMLRLCDAGEIVPDGSRWSWPAAAAGRLRRDWVAAPVAATTDAVRTALAAGDARRAFHGWSRLRGISADEDHALRHELVPALLRDGDPARALPLTGDLPLLRLHCLFDLGRPTDAVAALPAARAAATSSADRRRLARIEAQLHAARGQPAEALQQLRTALGSERSPRETQAEAVLLEMVGRTDEAHTRLRALLPALTAADSPFLRAAVQTSLGLIERRRGEHDSARQRFEDARTLLFRLGHARHAATAAANLGLALRDLGRVDAAVESLRQARSLFLHVGDATGAAIVEANLGITALNAGDPLAAERRLQPAIVELRRLGSHAAAAMATVMLAKAQAQQGHAGAARATLLDLEPQTADTLRAEVDAIRELLVAASASPPPSSSASPSPPVVSDPSAPNRELFRTFLAVNRRLAHESDLEKAMAYLLEAAVTLSGGRTGYLLVARPDGLRREFQSGATEPTGQAFSRSLANRAMQLRRTLTGDDGLADRELADMPSIRNLQVRSAICSPFASSTGAEGAIYVEHAGRAGVFTAQDKENLEVLADQAAIAVDRMLREERLAAELEHSQRELAVVQRTARREPTTLIGDSAVMRELRAQIDKLAQHDLSVLILGETGTGKELVARSIHESGPRRKGPFVAENCSALPAELMERELFGHVEGAFTGADRDRPGLLELASGGTLFLDEVGDMPAALQVKLLRALQEKAIRRVGGGKTIPVDLRILAATHKDLRGMVTRGEFREDLFFRLAAMELRVPPLRERAGDVGLLARTFLDRLNKQHGESRKLHEAALRQLQSHRWPGNVRELEHVMARAFLLAEGETITDLHLPVVAAPVAEAGTAAPAPTVPVAPVESPWPVLTLAEAERRTVLAALAACGGDKTKAARTLDISRTALYEKLKRYGQGRSE